MDDADYKETWATTPGLGIGWEKEESTDALQQLLAAAYSVYLVRLEVREQ
jgi:hypothetical protein